MADQFSNTYQGIRVDDNSGVGVGIQSNEAAVRFRSARLSDIETWIAGDYVRIFQVRPRERPISCKLYAHDGLAGTIDVGLMLSYEDGGGFPQASSNGTNASSHHCYADNFDWSGHHNGTELLHKIQAAGGRTIMNHTGYQNRMPHWQHAASYSGYGGMTSGKDVGTHGNWYHEIWDFVFRVATDPSGSDQGALHGLAPFCTVEMLYLEF